VAWKGDALENEQELLMLVSDVILDAFAAESVVMRAAAATASRHPAAALHADAAAVFVHDAVLRAGVAAHTAREAMTDPSLPVSRAGESIDPPAVNTIAARRRLADAATGVSRYIFSLT
jgi:butyryl-CoA dehydrogenase